MAFKRENVHPSILLIFFEEEKGGGQAVGFQKGLCKTIHNNVKIHAVSINVELLSGSKTKPRRASRWLLCSTRIIAGTTAAHKLYSSLKTLKFENAMVTFAGAPNFGEEEGDELFLNFKN